MATITIKNGINNTSLQIGDAVYYVPNASISDIGQQQTSTNDPIKIGTVNNISGNTITVNNPLSTSYSSDDFIMFSKDKAANNTSLIGYYAEVKLINDSTEEAELYSLNSNIAESSK